MRNSSYEENPILVEADPEKAKKHGDNYMLHDAIGRPLSVFSSSPADFGENGIGLEMYLVYMKQMIWLFAILSIIASPVLVINYMGAYLNTAQSVGPWVDSTIANQKGIPVFTTNITDAEAAIQNQEVTMFTTISLDLLYSLAFLIIIYIIAGYNSKRIENSTNVMPGDYAIQLNINQGSFTDEESISNLFSKFGVIHECVIPAWFGRKL